MANFVDIAPWIDLIMVVKDADVQENQCGWGFCSSGTDNYFCIGLYQQENLSYCLKNVYVLENGKLLKKDTDIESLPAFTCNFGYIAQMAIEIDLD